MSTSKVSKLTDLQFLILSKASQRDDHAIELPPNLKGSAAANVVKKLVDGDLVEEVAAKAGIGEARRTKAPPPIPPVPEKRSLKPGTILVREHEGVLHQVAAVNGGFAWNETTYRSLSEVARAITGTNWNGPRFFGLREKAKPAGSTPAPEHATP
jgi:hypothetical protein